MPDQDPADFKAEFRELKFLVERLLAGRGDDGDSEHPGSGSYSLQLGPEAEATNFYAIALGLIAMAYGSDGIAIGRVAQALQNGDIGIGYQAKADGIEAMALGYLAEAAAYRAIAIGRSAEAAHANSVAIGPFAFTAADNEIAIGSEDASVIVRGSFSNPSARRLKRKIVAAPCLTGLFPRLYEWQYKRRGDGRRQISPLADELVGTDAERFLTYDAKGRVAGIRTLELHTAQIYAVHAENAELRAEVADLRGAKDDLQARLTALEDLVKGLTNG
jgi:hypothetical protein